MLYEKNPYTPNAGATPAAIIGRQDLLDSFSALLARIGKGRPEQSMIITGLRGVGKTVLLNQFRHQAEIAGWQIIEFEVTKYSEDAFRREITTQLRSVLLRISARHRWSDRVKHLAAVLTSFNLTFDPEGALSVGLNTPAVPGFADSNDLQFDLTQLFVALGEAVQESTPGRGVVLLIDEIQFLDRPQLEALIVALHKVVQRALPITLVGAGLPQIAKLTGDAKSYSERLFKFPRIGNLGPDQSALALSQPAELEGVTYQDDALKAAFEITDGYPYFIQELGYAVWLAARESPITLADVEQAKKDYEAKLDDSFFRVRMDRSTPLQRAYLRAMAELGSEPHSAQEVAKLLNRTSNQISPVRAGLINMGLLYTPDHGYAAFTVPHFDKYLIRTIPGLDVPEVQRRAKTD